MSRPTHEEWLPPSRLFSKWTLEDDDLDTIASMLGVPSDETRRAVLKAGLERLAEDYLYNIAREAEPPPTWYIDQLNEVRTATVKLSAALQDVRGMARADLVSTLIRRFQVKLFEKPGSDGPSLERMLDQLTRACELAGPAKDEIKSGRRSTTAVYKVVRSAIQLYLNVTGSKKFPKSFGRDLRTREFTAPQARYLSHVLKLIDPRVTTDMIANNGRRYLNS